MKKTLALTTLLGVGLLGFACGGDTTSNNAARNANTNAVVVNANSTNTTTVGNAVNSVANTVGNAANTVANTASNVANRVVNGTPEANKANSANSKTGNKNTNKP